MSSDIVVIKCFVEEYRQKLVDELKLKNPSVSLNVIKQRVDAHVFPNIPDDWRTPLKTNKVNLPVPSSDASIINDYSPFDFHFEVLCATNTKAFKNRREKAISKHGKNFSYVSDLFECSEKWGDSSTRVKRTRTTYDKTQFMQWTTECTLLAYRKQKYEKVGCPCAAWRIRAKLLLPLGSNFQSKYDQIPIVRIELLNIIQYGETERALYESIYWFINIYSEEISWLISVGPTEYFDGEHYPAQIKIEVFFEANDYKNRDAFAAWFNQKIDSIENSNDFRESDHLEPVTCSICLGEAPIEDVPQRKNVSNVSTQYREGELFILCEFQLNNICVFKDATLHSKDKVDVRENYLNEWRISPEEMLNQLHFDKSLYYSEVKDGIAWREAILDMAMGDGDRFCAIRDALIALDVPPGKYTHPWAMLLFDPISRRHRVEIGRSPKSISVFLANNLRLLNIDGTLPKAVKASARILKGNPQIENDLIRLGIDVVRPLSGADGGARLSGLWRIVAESLTKDKYIPDAPSPKWKWSEFVSDINVVSEYLNGGSADVLERLGLEFPYFPQSLKSIETNPE